MKEQCDRKCRLCDYCYTVEKPPYCQILISREHSENNADSKEQE